AGPRGGPAGDLYVSVHVTPHSHLVRSGDELWYRLPVSVVQASLGTRAELDTLDGPYDIEVPAGTQHGAALGVGGRGAPHLRKGGGGDLVVEVHVEAPTKLSAEEAELLAQFAELRGEQVTPPHDGLFSRIRSAFKS